MSTSRYVTAPDGVRLSVTVSGTGPSLVLVHGSAQSGSSWGGVVSELEGDFTCFAVDRRGHGASSDTEEHSLQREADDVIAVAEQIGPDAVIVAHAYGAIVVLEAVRRSVDVAAIVLYEPPLPISERVASANRDTRDAWRDRSAVVTREWLAVRRSVEAIGEYTRAAIPMCLLEGTNSPPQFREPVGYLARRVPGVRVKELAGQDHFAHREAPVMFARVLRELLLG